MEIPLEFIAFIAIFLGVCGRTYFPYLRKSEESRTPDAGTGVAIPLVFDRKFYLTAIFSGLVTAIFIYPIFVLPEDATMMSVFIAAFIFAWGTNDVVNSLSH
jgi:hypothetical protein